MSEKTLKIGKISKGCGETALKKPEETPK